MSLYALVGRRGDIGKRYTAKQAREMYRQGVARALAGDLLQVWQAMQNGDLLRYDAERTRRLSDHVFAARRNTFAGENVTRVS